MVPAPRHLLGDRQPPYELRSERMVTLRCTKKLRERVGRHVPMLETRGTGETHPPTLADWTANVVVIGRQHLVLAVNDTTLLPVVWPIAPAKTALPRFAAAAGDVLLAMGIDRQRVLAEAAAMSDVAVGPTNNRRVLGTMNDFAWLMEAYVVGRSLTAVALLLAEAPCSPIGMRSPIDVASEAFGVTRVRIRLTPSLH